MSGLNKDDIIRMAREMEPSTAIAYVRSKAAEIRSRGQQ